MELNEIYVLVCHNEEGDLMSIVASDSIDVLMTKMENEWNDMVDTFIDEGYEHSDDASYINKEWHHAVAATSEGEESRYYSWDIKKIPFWHGI